ncbi:hypothetical protein [Rhodoferax sp.]|uniref:hypothetical protein n=1 Tax=Rhodoferax sp. TaxID=50421 RepID=UPI002ACDDDAE|nr:hypothetical protein [Rhodoferax sp.]MDZ7922072.1 hypothetical protein [Rhodoferax sp.]
MTVGSFVQRCAFVPDVAMKSDAYAVITPSGERLPLTQIQYLKDLATFEWRPAARCLPHYQWRAPRAQGPHVAASGWRLEIRG